MICAAGKSSRSEVACDAEKSTGKASVPEQVLCKYIKIRHSSMHYRSSIPLAPCTSISINLSHPHPVRQVESAAQKSISEKEARMCFASNCNGFHGCSWQWDHSRQGAERLAGSVIMRKCCRLPMHGLGRSSPRAFPNLFGYEIFYRLPLPIGTKTCVQLGHFGNCLPIVVELFATACDKLLAWHSV